jgi:hypothetical protein
VRENELLSQVKAGEVWSLIYTGPTFLVRENSWRM